MLREMLTGKIHRATVTDAHLEYIGSITVDSYLMDRAGILPGQKVQVVNNNNGARFTTYTISGERNSGVICLNGAAARLAQKGDRIIIMAFGLLDENEILTHEAKIVFVDSENNIVE